MCLTCQSRASDIKNEKIKWFRMMGLTFWEPLHVTTLQAKLGEGGDLAEDHVGPLALGQCMAERHVKVRKGGQMPETFGHQKWENKMIPNDMTHYLGESPSSCTSPCWASAGQQDFRSLRTSPEQQLVRNFSKIRISTTGQKIKWFLKMRLTFW